ncbi:MAG: aminotransferase class I/II-fold pyridoxal phosphate-dependent enzyme [Deltaproteobacteria bacterium]|nr:aminotransferase class I/II-fold pyridoxal phosphate-dependent enzyme [Deltaproteobacteria bacterium]
MKRKFTSLPADTPTEEIQRRLTPKLHYIPLVDGQNRPVDYACAHRFRRIQVAQPLLTGNELAYVTDCIQTNWISSAGKYVQRFEQMFQEYCGVPHALAVANGTVALHLALDALGIKAGDEVIVPDFTFAASINSVLYTGATPVLVDVLPGNWTMDPEAVKKAITPRTKAIMPVHLYGYPCHMDELRALADRHGLFLVEDCAEALGSRYKDRPVGSFGEANTFSFYGNKTITTGEGGMITFTDAKAYERAAILRDHGMSKQRRYWHDHVGYNYRLTNLQAAVGVAQMERIDFLVAAKRRLGEIYTRELSELKGLVPPPRSPDVVNSYWLFTMLATDECGVARDDLIAKLLLNGIETRPVFFPLHQMPPYQKYAPKGGCPVTDRVSSQGLSLPSAVSLTDAEIESVCSSLKSILGRRNLFS